MPRWAITRSSLRCRAAIWVAELRRSWNQAPAAAAIDPIVAMTSRVVSH
jgi:hypothetical protein